MEKMGKEKIIEIGMRIGEGKGEEIEENIVKEEEIWNRGMDKLEKEGV